jgi:hypothetical protein
MPVEPSFAEIVQTVGAFHITDRVMKRAQEEVEAAMRAETLDSAAQSRYLKAVRGYFSGFEKEAREHLRDVDRRLEQINQVHFNLTAERGVAAKRIEATQGVLHRVAALEDVAR